MADQIKLGVLIDEHQHRDAIHIAVAPVIAAEVRLPGMDIGLLSGSQEQVSRSAKHIGIVDPFLKLQVQPGQRFYMFLYPQTITSLRHEWTHPAFQSVTAPVGVSDSEKWLREYASGLGVDYRELMDGADAWVVNDEYFMPSDDAGMLEGISTDAEFWPHYEKVRGVTVDANRRRNFFTCSC